LALNRSPRVDETELMTIALIIGGLEVLGLALCVALARAASTDV
jgi:hypothetical protein